MAVQPLPDGATINWSASTDKGWSNFSYSVWYYLPNSTNAIWVTNTTAISFKKTTPILDGTMFGVTVTAQTNGFWKTGDVGIAPWPPLLSYGPGSVRITPNGGVEVDTNKWVKLSYDLKTFTETLRFNILTNGRVRVEHSVSTSRPALFMAYPTPPAPPPAPGAAKNRK